MQRSLALELPEMVVTKADVTRLIRELEEYSDAVYQAELRGGQNASTQYLSPGAQLLVQHHGALFQTSQARRAFIDELRTFQKTAVQVHVSFASQPSPSVVQRITAWFRRNTQENVVLQIGVDPSIIAGCVVRTTNKVFRFSLAEALRASAPVLEKEVAAL